MKGKYIIMEHMGTPYPVLIPNGFIEHVNAVPRAGGKPISAGFFDINIIPTNDSIGVGYDVHCFGKSTSLRLEHRPEDANIILKQFC